MSLLKLFIGYYCICFLMVLIRNSSIGNVVDFLDIVAVFIATLIFAAPITGIHYIFFM